MSEQSGAADWKPLILAVAPNGARKTKADHPALPMNPEEIAETGAVCCAAGAAMIHLHVRDDDGGHSLSPAAYRDAIAALRDRVGENLVIQVTSEAVGIYGPEQQMAMVRELEPEAVSIAIRELLPEDGPEEPFGDFAHWMADRGILPQWILYSSEDVERFQSLKDREIIPSGPSFRLYVLGRYTKNQRSEPGDLLPFLASASGDDPWAICAFGPKETASAVTAAALGGHARVGFENNLYLPDGQRAPDNAALVAAVASGARAIGRPLASATEAREIIGARANTPDPK